METKTIWKKNLDSAFVFGEDLILGVKGLKPEMVVTLNNFKDDVTFDQNKQAKITITGLYLKEVGGNDLYKPVILNKTNAKFFVKETGSVYMEDWIGKQVTIYAQKDSRFGYVVRFKSYVKPTLIAGTDNFNKAKTALLSGSYTMDQVKSRYVVSAEVEALLNAK